MEKQHKPEHIKLARTLPYTVGTVERVFEICVDEDKARECLKVACVVGVHPCVLAVELGYVARFVKVTQRDLF